MKRNVRGVLLELQECLLALPTNVSIPHSWQCPPPPYCPSRKSLNQCLTASLSLPLAVSPRSSCLPISAPVVVSPHMTASLES